jgi:hypothetical protein
MTNNAATGSSSGGGSSSSSSGGGTTNRLAVAAASIDVGAPLPIEEALAVIVRNVQGAQARQRMKTLQSAKKQVRPAASAAISRLAASCHMLVHAV